MNPSWTRDEVILGIDVALNHSQESITPKSSFIIELSKLLNNLPIIPKEKRDSSFRNPVGVSGMLNKFLSMLAKPNQKFPVGKLFFDVYDDYYPNLLQLSATTDSIRRNYLIIRNNPSYILFSIPYFKEGIVLSVIHTLDDKKYVNKETDLAKSCDICGINPENIYSTEQSSFFLQSHYCIDPINYYPGDELKPCNYIKVCPNCHEILHLFRPWRTQETIETILR